jgi:hypothetical protein
MELDTLDVPKSVDDSAKFVMENASHVTIDDEALSALAGPIRERFNKGFDNVEDAFGSTDDLDKDINLVFFETAANFCFWAQDPTDKWKFDYEGQANGGWYGLRNAFDTTPSCRTFSRRGRRTDSTARAARQQHR